MCRPSYPVCIADDVAGVIDMSNCCMQLQELDISGCWKITNKSLYALQENLLHMRERKSDFSLMVGGIIICVNCKVSAVTLAF